MVSIMLFSLGKGEEKACKPVSGNVSLRVSISNALMQGLPTVDSDSFKPKGEEFPIEEFEDVPDWNAKAWEQIRARDAETSRKRLSLTKILTGYSMTALESAFAVLNRKVLTEGGDVELRDAIATEIERRVDAGDTELAQ